MQGIEPRKGIATKDDGASQPVHFRCKGLSPVRGLRRR